MAFTGDQVKELRAKLEARHVKTRNANGVSLNYVEGWHVIAEAKNREWPLSTLPIKSLTAIPRHRGPLMLEQHSNCASANAGGI
jgi:hypothetical protein